MNAFTPCEWQDFAADSIPSTALGTGGTSMTTTIVVEGKIVGRKKPVQADWLLALPMEWEAPGERI